MQLQRATRAAQNQSLCFACHNGIIPAPQNSSLQSLCHRGLFAVGLVCLLLVFSSPADASHTVTCRADLPVHPGEPMTWRAIVTGGSGSFAFSWTGEDGLTGNSQAVTMTYTDVGFKEARVTVTDTAQGDTVAADCGMHVIPVSFSEPPSVTPILWVPSGVDPAPLVPQLERVWRSIHAGFYHLYGKTFAMQPMLTIVSSSTENDICGGDCTDLGKSSLLVNQAYDEAIAQIGGVIPYTRAILLMAWGGGGHAGAFGWDFARGAVGDWAIAPAAGVKTPAIEPDAPPADILLGYLTYDRAVNGTIAHELNHVIGWDEPHDFHLLAAPTDYEKQVSLAGPFLTETPEDVTKPAVSFSQPASGATLSGTATVSVSASDDVAMDAVAFLVDDQLMVIDDTKPFSFQFDTTKVGFESHQLQAIAYDTTGNTTSATREVIVKNVVAETSCSRSFPVGTFHACFYDGIDLSGPYLGTLLDTPFPVPSSNVGAMIHSGSGEVAFGQSDTVSGVWRGTLDLPPGNYRLSFLTNDGLRVYIDGIRILNEWRDQHATFTEIIAVDGPTRIRIEWFDNGGDHHLHFRWQPTVQPPSVEMVTDFPEAISVQAGTLAGGNATSLAADDNNYLRVRSTTSGTRTAAWLGRFDEVSNDLRNLRVSYKGSNSQVCAQTIDIWRWTTSTWVRLNSRNVGTTEVAINSLMPPGAAANFVSNTSGNGIARLRVRCQKSGTNFTTRGDLLRLDYILP